MTLPPAPLMQGAALYDAIESDLEGIVGIHNELVANTTAVFASLPVTMDERRRWWQALTAQGYPVLVARDAQGSSPLAPSATFAPGPLIERARALGKHIMIAGR